jgi:sporulation integral membrane protein YlbJ
MRPLFNVPAQGSIALILGFLSGFPVGAKTAVNLYEKGLCTKTEAERLLTFSNNPSPAFVLGTIGVGIWANNSIGWLLWGIQTLSAIIIGAVFGSRWKKTLKKVNNISTDGEGEKASKINIIFSKALTDAVKSSALGILNICAFVIFFSIIIKLFSVSALYTVLTGFLSDILPFFKDSFKPMMSGILEMTTGINLIDTNADFIQNMTLTAGILGWSGISVHCQVMSFLYEGGLSPKPYILS